ncbi:hypothetical protein Hanom_Chr00s146134g01820361 [Helianthus anomalus]
MRAWRLTCSLVVQPFRLSSVCVKIARLLLLIECIASPANVTIKRWCIMRCPALC